MSSEKMSSDDLSPYRDAALRLAPAAALLANYCDHAEHVEELERSWIIEAAEVLERCAFAVSDHLAVDLLDLYAARLTAIEERNILSFEHSLQGGKAAGDATSWRDLQLVQANHDRYYHPDVFGLAKIDQLRHYAFHLAKLVGAFAASTDEDELRDRRLPDALLFAIKLRTIAGSRMPDTPLPRRA